MKISKITVGRLYNLGSYEHVRYDLTVEIPEGESAVTAIVSIERLLEGLNPARLKVCKTEHELKCAELRLQEDALSTDDDFHRRYGHGYAGSRAEYQDRMRKSWEEEKAKREKALKIAKRTRELFDNLGGAAEYKDAKLSWDDDNYEEEA